MNHIVDGTPAPNPSYEIPIHNVKGSNKFKIQNKNLFDITETPLTNTSTTRVRPQKYTLLKKGTYVISFIGADQVYIMWYDKEYNKLGETNWGNSEFTFSLSESYYIIPVFRKNNNQNILAEEIKNIQIEQGTTVTDYVPHQEQNLPLDLRSKNLFDKNNVNVLNAFFNAGVITSSSSGSKTIFIKCKSNSTYTMSKIASARFQVAYTDTIPVINSTVAGTIVNNEGTSITITTGNNAKYLVAFIYTNSDTLSFEEILNTIQIEEGSTATDYVPYYNYELSKIDTAEDYFLKENGKWYLHKEIGKEILDGVNKTLLYHMLANTIHCGFINLSSSIAKPNDNNIEIKTKSNRFISYSINYLISTAKIGVGVRTDGLVFFSFGENTTLKSSELINQWLQNNNLIFNYPLATPTNTEITETPLINQLEAIRKAQSYNDQTNINQTNEDLPFKLDITALKK